MATPKGIRTRSTPDWYTRYASTGALQVLNGPPSHFQYICLYNDSTIGAFLFVHWIMAVASVASAMLFYFRQGKQGSTQVSCIRINPTLAAPPGVITFFDNDVVQIPDSPILLQSTFTGGAIAGGPPILVVPPGYSLVAGTTVADGAPGVSFQYIPMTDVNGRQAI